MVKLLIDLDKCDYCLDCVANCPSKALHCQEHFFIHEQEDCSYCENCMDLCPQEAIELINE